MFNSITDPYLISGAAGLLCSAAICFYLGGRLSLPKGRLLACYLYAVAGMFVGAHFLFFIVNLPTFSEKYADSIVSVQTFINAILNASSGMVFYGGLFGAVLGVMLFCRVNHLDKRTYLNITACCCPALHGFGRIGCALGGCCYGIEYHGPLAMMYTPDHINPGISDHIADFPRFPVQPLEAFLEFVICAVLIILFIKLGRCCSLISVYFFTYGVVRFFDEFLRGDTIRGLWGPFSTSQWIALISIISVAVYTICKRKYR